MALTTFKSAVRLLQVFMQIFGLSPEYYIIFSHTSFNTISFYQNLFSFMILSDAIIFDNTILPFPLIRNLQCGNPVMSRRLTLSSVFFRVNIHEPLFSFKRKS